MYRKKDCGCADCGAKVRTYYRNSWPGLGELPSAGLFYQDAAPWQPANTGAGLKVNPGALSSPYGATPWDSIISSFRPGAPVLSPAGASPLASSSKFFLPLVLIGAGALLVMGGK